MTTTDNNRGNNELTANTDLINSFFRQFKDNLKSDKQTVEEQQPEIFRPQRVDMAQRGINQDKREES